MTHGVFNLYEAEGEVEEHLIDQLLDELNGVAADVQSFGDIDRFLSAAEVLFNRYGVQLADFEDLIEEPTADESYTLNIPLTFDNDEDTLLDFVVTYGYDETGVFQIDVGIDSDVEDDIDV